MTNTPPPQPSVPAWRILALPILLSVGLYAILFRQTAGMALSTPSFAHQVFPWVRQLAGEKDTAGQTANIGFALSAAALFALYGWMLHAVRNNRSRDLERWILVAGAAPLALGLTAPSMLSTDVFAYGLYGRVFSIYGANPYAESPPVPASDPFLVQFGQKYLPSWYGPVWTLISAGLAWIGRDNLGWTVLLFRATASAAALATAGLILACLRRTAPERAAQGVVFFLWNPLLLLETGLSGHNDPVMLGFVLLAVWLHLRGWRVPAILCLVLSALVKFLTGFLAPLYGLMILRQLPDWRRRLSFAAASAVSSLVLCVAVFMAARIDANLPAAKSATAPDFYSNNFHELIFKRLRRWLGEDEDAVRESIYFGAWWIAPKAPIGLHQAPSETSPTLRTIQSGERLLVCARQETEWARVYDMASRQKGYVNTTHVEVTERPASADNDPVAREISMEATTRDSVITANRWIRLVCWSVFAGIGLLAAVRVTDIGRFGVWSTAVLIASYYLIITEIWPWYVNWALALGALAPLSLPSRFAVLLSGMVMTLNLTIGFQGSHPAWVFEYRALLAFIAPAVLFILLHRRSLRDLLRGAPQP